MIDRENVIDALQDAVNDDWMWQHANYYALTMERAIALLKEQEPAKPREERHEVKVSHDWGDEVEVWSKFYCPHCGAMIANSNSQHFPRCMWCGRKVKWK